MRPPCFSVHLQKPALRHIARTRKAMIAETGITDRPRTKASDNQTGPIKHHASITGAGLSPHDVKQSGRMAQHCAGPMMQNAFLELLHHHQAYGFWACLTPDLRPSNVWASSSKRPDNQRPPHALQTRILFKIEPVIAWRKRSLATRTTAAGKKRAQYQRTTLEHTETARAAGSAFLYPSQDKG